MLKQILRLVAIESVVCTLPYYFAYDSKWKNSWENRLFRQHANTAKHKHQSSTCDPAPGQTRLKMTSALQLIEDPAVWICIQTAWWLAKEDIAIHKFASLVELSLSHMGYIPNSYMDDKMAWEMIVIVGKHFRQTLKTRVQNSPYFGIMIDETTDRSITSQLIIYIKFLEKNKETGTMEVKIEYLDLITPKGGSAHEITVLFNTTRANTRKLFTNA